MKEAHIRDAVALCRFFSWLEDELNSGVDNITEVDASDKLLSFRKEMEVNF